MRYESHILVVFKEMLWYIGDKHLKNSEKCPFYSIFTAKNDITCGQANLSICIDTSKSHVVNIETISDESISFSPNLPPKMPNAIFTVIHDLSRRLNETKYLRNMLMLIYVCVLGPNTHSVALYE